MAKRSLCGLLTGLALLLGVVAGTTATANEEAGADGITLASPHELQVFQRRTRAEGPVLVKGSLAEPAEEVQVVFKGKPMEGALPGPQKVPLAPDHKSFEKEITLPAGGWYTMELTATFSNGKVASHELEKIGVGEVFVGAGQSNSTNCGQFPIKQSSGMVSSFSGEDGRWQIADDPQPGVADKSQGGSFWPAFGDAMYERYHVPIGVATTGFGGTSVNQWHPEKGLYKEWLMKRVGQLGPHGFRAILWHQGESDVQMPSDEYYDKLKEMIESSRRDAGWEIPWFVAQVSYHNPEKPRFESTRQAQAKLWADGVALEGPDTDTLTGSMRDHDGKGIHFSPEGLKAHGRMWAEKVGPVLDKSLKQ